MRAPPPVTSSVPPCPSKERVPRAMHSAVAATRLRATSWAAWTLHASNRGPWKASPNASRPVDFGGGNATKGWLATASTIPGIALLAGAQLPTGVAPDEGSGLLGADVTVPQDRHLRQVFERDALALHQRVVERQHQHVLPLVAGQSDQLGKIGQGFGARWQGRITLENSCAAPAPVSR